MSGRPPAPVRWGILGAAQIAASQFLPGLREAGGGTAVVVASRELGRATEFAGHNGVEKAVEGYEAVLESEEVDAVYVALPNSYHAHWTMRSLEAGKTTLCEKPLCASPPETEQVLAKATSTGRLLWESFVFPFQDQHRRLLELLAAGAVGEVQELVSPFHFKLTRPVDIRLSASLAGGALNDVGCYPIRLAQEVLVTHDPMPSEAAGFARIEGDVDTETAAVVDYGDQRLVLSCGFRRAMDTFTRVVGSTGQIHLDNPFHPRPSDRLVVRSGGRETVEQPTVDERPFSAALRHIHAAIRGEEEPRHLAVAGSSLRLSRTLEAVARACRQD